MTVALSIWMSILLFEKYESSRVQHILTRTCAALFAIYGFLGCILFIAEKTA